MRSAGVPAARAADSGVRRRSNAEARPPGDDRGRNSQSPTLSPVPELVERAHGYAQRIAGAMAALSEARDEAARERAWRSVMADEAIGAEVRRLIGVGRDGRHLSVGARDESGITHEHLQQRNSNDRSHGFTSTRA